MTTKIKIQKHGPVRNHFFKSCDTADGKTVATVTTASRKHSATIEPQVKAVGLITGRRSRPYVAVRTDET